MSTPEDMFVIMINRSSLSSASTLTKHAYGQNAICIDQDNTMRGIDCKGRARRERAEGTNKTQVRLTELCSHDLGAK